ncbi:MAG TPA: amidohydrolase family protein [Pelobium sp.]|nr:amidohydrolase family protein [Pelobium sp.]
MLKIDSHQHFWTFDPIRDAWITPDLGAIAHDFMPLNLKPHLDEFGFEGCIVVQSSQSADENLFQLENATQHHFIKGIVGWVDFEAPNLEEQLQEYQKQPLLKGFRHILQGEANRAILLEPVYKTGLNLLKKYGFTYDVLIFKDQLVYLHQFLMENDSVPMVLDHLAKPDIKSGKITDWAVQMKEVAAYQNLYCKVSGMVTEADWLNWKYEDFEPFIDVAFNTFGADRLMFGSDWPVCNLAGGYQKVVELVERYTKQLSNLEQEKFWGLNASEFYKIKL